MAPSHQRWHYSSWEKPRKSRPGEKLERAGRGRAGQKAAEALDLEGYPGCKRLLQLFADRGVQQTPLAVVHEHAARSGLQVLVETEPDSLYGGYHTTARLMRGRGEEPVAVGLGRTASRQLGKQAAATALLERLLATGAVEAQYLLDPPRGGSSGAAKGRQALQQQGTAGPGPRAPTELGCASEDAYLEGCPACRLLMDLFKEWGLEKSSPLQVVNEHAARMKQEVVFKMRHLGQAAGFSVEAQLVGRSGSELVAVGRAGARNKQDGKQAAAAVLLERLLESGAVDAESLLEPKAGDKAPRRWEPPQRPGLGWHPSLQRNDGWWRPPGAPAFVSGGLLLPDREGGFTLLARSARPGSNGSNGSCVAALAPAPDLHDRDAFPALAASASRACQAQPEGRSLRLGGAGSSPSSTSSGGGQGSSPQPGGGGGRQPAQRPPAGKPGVQQQGGARAPAPAGYVPPLRFDRPAPSGGPLLGDAPTPHPGRLPGPAPAAVAAPSGASCIQRELKASPRQDQPAPGRSGNAQQQLQQSREEPLERRRRRQASGPSKQQPGQEDRPTRSVQGTSHSSAPLGAPPPCGGGPAVASPRGPGDCNSSGGGGSSSSRSHVAPAVPAAPQQLQQPVGRVEGPGRASGAQQQPGAFQRGQTARGKPQKSSRSSGGSSSGSRRHEGEAAAGAAKQPRQEATPAPQLPPPLPPAQQQNAGRRSRPPPPKPAKQQGAPARATVAGAPGMPATAWSKEAAKDLQGAGGAPLAKGSSRGAAGLLFHRAMRGIGGAVKRRP